MPNILTPEEEREELKNMEWNGDYHNRFDDDYDDDWEEQWEIDNPISKFL